MIFIGDVHGDFDAYAALVSRFGNQPTIQVGDMGIFPFNASRFTSLNIPNNHRFIRGNHDDADVCQNVPNYMGDFGFDSNSGIFYVGGAWSVDWERQRARNSYCMNEQLTEAQFEAAFDFYVSCKPQIVVSHDCPIRVYPEKAFNFLLIH